MTTKEEWGIFGCASEIVTAVIAVVASVFYWRLRRIKMKMLLEILKRDASPGMGSRSLLHMQMHTGLSEAELLEASFQSRFIRRWSNNDKVTGQTIEIRYEFDPEGKQHAQYSMLKDSVPVPIWLLLLIVCAFALWFIVKNL